MRIFLDCGEGRELETESFSCEDLSGWLIPAQQVEDFRSEFETGDVSERWTPYICFAIWSLRENNIFISFETYD